MKNISNHLGEIVVGLAGVALLITAVVAFKIPINDFFVNIASKNDFFVNIASKEITIGEKLFENLENVDLMPDVNNF